MLEKRGPQVRAGGAQVPSRYLDEANPSLIAWPRLPHCSQSATRWCAGC